MRWFLLLLIIFRAGPGAFAQDVGFSQFYDQPLLRNPALAGIFTGDVRLSASFRNQWQSVTVPYKTYGLSSEIKIPVNAVPYDNLTIGLELLRDVAGTSEFSTLQILPALNYSLPLSRAKTSFLSLGVMGGLMQQRFDPTKLVFNDQFVAGSNGAFTVLPVSGQVFNNTSINYPDLSVGVSYNGSLNDDVDYYLGTGMFHLTRPNVGFFEGNVITLNRKAAFNFGMISRTSETDQVIVYGDYFKQFNYDFKPVGISILQVGLLFNRDLWGEDEDNRKGITFGVLYRWNDAVIPVVQLEVSKLMISTSYDVNISKLVVASQYRGGLELTLTYKDLLNSRRRGQGAIPCPKFGGHLPNAYFIGIK
jgi:type IX secretion system PorP/SprF family membrane protein